MTDIIRVLRVLEYTGPRNQVESCLALNHVKGEVTHGALTIREATLGMTAEVLERKDPNSLVYDLLREQLTLAKDYFPDNDSQRLGYLQALNDLLEKLA